MKYDLLHIQPPWLNPRCPREGRYVLGPLLGKGGMGEVVEAWDVVLCRTVALKILRNMEPTALIRFMHEAQIQARVAHPNICRIYDVESSESTVKIAMQLVRGTNLELASRELSVQANVTLLAQVAEAIHAAHGLKLIHRDLKPSNILLEKGPNGNWIPYICDFGLAMSLDEPALTATNGAIGTPAYMAPEQFHGERHRIGPGTDVYGLGGTLHFALLGEPPVGPTHGPRLNFPGSSHTPKAAGGVGLPGDLRTIVNKCLEADPAARYPTAAALAQDLWRFVHGEPILGTTPSLPFRLWRRCRPYAFTSGLAAASLLTVCAGEGLYFGAVRDAHLNVTRIFDQESADLERTVRMERMLPEHDLRPANSWIQTRLGLLRSRIATLGGPAQLPGHLALARVGLLLGDTPQALRDAQQARTLSPRDPEAAYLLALATAKAALAAQSWEPPGPADPALGPRLESLFRAGRNSGDQDYPHALVAFLRKDFATAALCAGAAFNASPWDEDAACLEALSHCALAIQQRSNGDLPGAEAQCREAMAGARRFLAVGRSSETVYHAYFLAARWLISIQGDQGSAIGPGFEDLESLCDHALRLDPDSPELQEDWLSLRFLRSRYGPARNPQAMAGLKAAMGFMATRLREPLPPGLRDARMLVLWATAEQHLEQGQDPGPLLAEALKTTAQAPFLRRDYRSQVLSSIAQARRPHATGGTASWR